MNDARIAWSAPDREQITAVVLAGGLGRRMSSDGRGVDKGLATLAGEPMVAHVVRRLAPQVGALLINANRHADRYERLGHRVIADRVPDFAGPLAGLHAAMCEAHTRWVVTAPCDSPRIPANLVERLAAALRGSQRPIAVARVGGRLQPVFALVSTALRAELERYLEGGGRKIERWFDAVGAQPVDFDDADAFVNVNTAEELRHLEFGLPPIAPGPIAMPSRQSLADVVRGLPDYDPDALPVMAAQQIIERLVVPVQGWESVAVRESLGRVLVQDVTSPLDVPAHDNSAMDGYAVRAADLASDGPTPLALAGSALAGRPYDGACLPGQAIRVTTGAVMPQGTDTVVVQEVVRIEGDQVTIPPGQQAGQNRRLRGEDLAAGRAALHGGRILTASDLGLVASLGIGEVKVRRRLRVALFSTGDEIRSIGEPLGPGQIYDSNRYTIHAMLLRLGFEPIDMGVVRDDPAALEQAMRDAATSADAIVSSGGVSVGEADFTRAIMARLGDVAFWKIAMRPGRPMAFGRVGEAFYFGLPGNPVAVMITFFFFARAALLRLAGATEPATVMVRARSAEAIRKKPGRTEYQRARIEHAPDGTLTARLTGSQGSGVLRSMSEANCIVVLGHEQGNVAAGDMVDCLPFHGLL